MSHKELARKLDELERKYDENFRVVFEAIRQLMAPPLRRKRENVSVFTLTEGLSMPTASQWDEHNLTDLIRQILRTADLDDKYSTGRAFLTTYQIAIELQRRFPQVVANLNVAMGGSGQGSYALTTYLARWLPDRIMNRGVTDIELRFLAPNHLKTLEFDDDGTVVVATTHQSGFRSTMFRYVGPD